MSDENSDRDNPLWTSADFARAAGPEVLPAAMLAAFPNTVARLANAAALHQPVMIRSVALQSPGFRTERRAA
jgi:hypothetical protein